MTRLIELPVTSKVLFKSTAVPVAVTHNKMYHGTVTYSLPIYFLFIYLTKYRLGIHYRHIFDVYAEHSHGVKAKLIEDINLVRKLTKDIRMTFFEQSCTRVSHWPIYISC